MRFVPILDRYVIREVAGPAMLGFVTYTFLLMMRGIFTLMEQVFVRGVPLTEAAHILLLTTPHVVVLTIPMSYLFGALLAMGRLNIDSELVALQASGVPAFRLLRPVVVGGLALAALNASLYLWLMPEASRQLRLTKIRLFASSTSLGRIEPGVFHEGFPNLLVYVGEVDAETGAWHDVLLYDSSDPKEERLTLAKRGQMVTRGRGDSNVEGSNGEPWIALEGVVNHQFVRADPKTYRMNSNQEQLYKVPLPDRSRIRYRPAMRERETPELFRFLTSRGASGLGGATVEPRELESKLREAGLELNRRIAIPMATVVFALLALPLGIGARAGGRGRGFILSIGVVLAYYVIGNHAELLARSGTIPVWLGAWLPDLLLTLLAVVLMQRMGRWLGERGAHEGIVARLAKEWKVWRTARRRHRRVAASGEELTGSIPITVQRRRYASRFPTLLDRYVVVRLVAPLLIVLLSTSALYIVVDLTDHVEVMARNHVPLSLIVAYYLNLLPQVILDVTPFGLMIALLIVLTVLERQQELTALKGAGISVFRLIVPVTLVAVAGAALLWTLGESIVPTANREATRLLDRIKGRSTARSYLATDRQWLLSRDRRVLYNFLRYDAASKSMIRLTMFRIDGEMELRFYLSAPRARYLNGGWIADGGWFRQIYPDGKDEFRRITEPLELGIPEGPAYFGQEYRRPGEMSIRELASYIRELEESGYRPSQQIVRLHQKLTYPLSALIMVLLALPFGLNRGGKRVTTMQGVAIALGLGIGYFVLTAIFGKMGEADVLPPTVGAWSPVVLATLFALNRMTTLRT